MKTQFDKILIIACAIILISNSEAITVNLRLSGKNFSYTYLATYFRIFFLFLDWLHEKYKFSLCPYKYYTFFSLIKEIDFKLSNII